MWFHLCMDLYFNVTFNNGLFSAPVVCCTNQVQEIQGWYEDESEAG